MDDKTLKRWASGPLCTIAQAAALLGVSSQTVRRMVLHGHLIAWRPNPAGRKRLLYRRQVEDLAAHSQSRAIRQARLMQDTFDFFKPNATNAPNVPNATEGSRKWAKVPP